jgi:hypothetical protein
LFDDAQLNSLTVEALQLSPEFADLIREGFSQDSGTVAASSLQPYFSAVNKFFRDHRRQPVAVGELLADARRGLEMLQQRLLPTTARLPLPAQVALDILHAANALHRTFAWTPASLPQMQSFKACLTVCVNYMFFCRAETGARC